MAEQRPALEDVLGAKHHWYHVVELEPGVTTPGWLDLRPHADAPQLPASMTGLRALDVGTFDGFWAFEMERRGADVIGIDIDQIPPPDTPRNRWAEVQQQLDGSVPGTGFRLLKEWFGASAERRAVNVYDLTTDAVDGPVDLVFLGAILQHLRDPVRALERAHEVLKPGGRVVLFEPIDPELSRQDEPLARLRIGSTIWTWWYANRACLTEWVRTAGFAGIQDLGVREVRDTTGNVQQVLTLHAHRA